MSLENKTYSKTRYDFTDFKDWFVKNNLYNDLAMFQPSPDGSTVLKITFKRQLTVEEKTLIKNKFPMIE